MGGLMLGTLINYDDRAHGRPPCCLGGVRNGLFLSWVAILAMLLSGCSSGGEHRAQLEDVRQSLISSGFDDAGVHVGRVVGEGSGSGLVTVVLVGESMSVENATKSGAIVIWDELPFQFDILVMEYSGEYYQFEYSELEAKLGPRPRGLDDSSVSKVADRLAWAALWMPAGIVLAIVLAVVFSVWWRRWHAERTVAL